MPSAFVRPRTANAATVAIGPVLLHFITRPGTGDLPGLDLPDTQQTCAVFAEAFLHAVAIDEADTAEQA
jgi:hypothetical protein